MYYSSVHITASRPTLHILPKTGGAAMKPHFARTFLLVAIAFCSLSSTANASPTLSSASSAGSGAAPIHTHVQIIPAVAAGSGSEQRRSSQADSAQLARQSTDRASEEKERHFEIQTPGIQRNTRVS